MKYCIIGNGPAGITAVQHIRKNDKSGDITVITEEKYPFYYKPKLPAMLAGEVSLDKITLRKPDWYETQKIKVLYETKVEDIDTEEKKIIFTGNKKISYDRLLLANGAYPFIPPVEGLDKDISGISAFRTADDVYKLDKIIGKINHVTMIGGGLLALENGYSLIKRGRKVRIIEMVPRLLPRQLDKDGADVLQKKLESMGFDFYLGRQTSRVENRENRVSNVRLDSGEKLKTNLLLVCAGIRPDLTLAEKAGIKTDKGVVVDEQMRTLAPDVWAAGDTASFEGKPGGLWTVAMQQGQIAGKNMSGENAEYIPEADETKLKVTGVDLVSSGAIDQSQNETALYTSDGVYRKLFIDNNGHAAGCILLGNTKNDKKIIELIKRKIIPGNHKDKIIDPDFSDWNLLMRD